MVTKSSIGIQLTQGSESRPGRFPVAVSTENVCTVKKILEDNRKLILREV